MCRECPVVYNLEERLPRARRLTTYNDRGHKAGLSTDTLADIERSFFLFLGRTDRIQP